VLVYLCPCGTVVVNPHPPVSTRNIALGTRNGGLHVTLRTTGFSQEATTAAPLEPEEPFDNSTYKNYQHHSYTPFTFADLDVEMAKFRLPQPSSGRPSPRH
uniref:NADH:ubiquinone oxidoreductase subunit V3 n=1 Tax=Stegastes partitus TaxID=144197 RepID=A0A3B4ZLS8_9TELE